MKTKKVAGVDCNQECFAYVKDENDSSTWNLPLYIPGNVGLTRNLIKCAVERFATAKMPDEQRAEVWRLIAGAAKGHGIKVGAQPAPTLPGSIRPLDAEETGLKEARAVGLLAAEKLLKKIGYGSDEDN